MLKRVLVVEDDEDVRVTLGDLLSSFGYETHLVKDGASAIASAKLLRPDVIILDLGLPGIDGLEAARQILADRSQGAPTIIALTARNQLIDQLEVSRAGIEFHLVKPVEPDTLRAMLDIPEETCR